MPPLYNPKWDYNSCVFFRQYKKVRSFVMLRTFYIRKIQILVFFQIHQKPEIYLPVNASTMFFSIYSTLSKTIGLKCAVMATKI